MATTKTAKIVTVIARVEFKCDSKKVCYLVRSSDGASQYTTCLFAGKATNCTCPSRSRCYHMTQVEQIEAERTAKAAREARLEAAYAETVAYIEAEQAQAAAAPREKSEQAAIAFLSLKEKYDYRAVPASTPEVPMGERGTLNNRNQGFSLLRR